MLYEVITKSPYGVLIARYLALKSPNKNMDPNSGYLPLFKTPFAQSMVNCDIWRMAVTMNTDITYLKGVGPEASRAFE